MLSPGELARRHRGGLGADGDLDPHGVPRVPLIGLDLDAGVEEDDLPDLLSALRSSLVPVIGLSSSPVAGDLLEALDLTVAPGSDRRTVPSLDLDAVHERVRRAPRATMTAARLLRQTETLGVRDGLAAESAAYSVLLAGPERAALLGPRPARPTDEGVRVRVQRRGTVLEVQLCRPDRRNRVDARLRDELCSALAVARADPQLQVRLSAEGEDWSTGGDLDEFGSLPDPATAHIVRQARSVGWALHCLGERVEVLLQGRCLGSGIELPAFAHRVRTTRTLSAALPELGLGLVPGAGGTVSIVRRIGRWRTLALLLTGEALDAATALRWGLVDEVLP